MGLFDRLIKKSKQVHINNYLETYIKNNKLCSDDIYRNYKEFLKVLYDNGGKVTDILWFDYCKINEQGKSLGSGGFIDKENEDYMWTETQMWDDKLDNKSLNELLDYIDMIIKKYPKNNLVPSFYYKFDNENKLVMLLSDNEIKEFYKKAYKYKKCIKIHLKFNERAKLNLIEKIIPLILKECTGENDYIYAIEHQHCYYKYKPSSIDYDLLDEYIKSKYPDIDNNYVPPIIPDGEECYFTKSDCSFGYEARAFAETGFSCWIWGEKFINLFNKYYNNL